MEALNTVLDDTRKLCLSSGETIPIRTPSMLTLFEVDELTHASPATVSRCGMVPRLGLIRKEVVLRS